MATNGTNGVNGVHAGSKVHSSHARHSPPHSLAPNTVSCRAPSSSPPSRSARATPTRSGRYPSFPFPRRRVWLAASTVPERHIRSISHPEYPCLGLSTEPPLHMRTNADCLQATKSPMPSSMPASERTRFPRLHVRLPLRPA
jgi:hypothetical protein